MPKKRVGSALFCGMEVPSVWKFITPPPMPYMSSRALKGLRDYKYVAGGYTWLDRVHTPYWNQIVEYFPLWLAPNLITLIGTGWLVLAYFVTSTYLPDLKGPPAPPPPSSHPGPRALLHCVLRNTLPAPILPRSLRPGRCVTAAAQLPHLRMRCLCWPRAAPLRKAHLHAAAATLEMWNVTYEQLPYIIRYLQNTHFHLPNLAQVTRPDGCTRSTAWQCSCTCTSTAWTASRRGARRRPPRWASCSTTVRCSDAPLQLSSGPMWSDWLPRLDPNAPLKGI